MNQPTDPRYRHHASRGASDAAAALQGANLAFSKSSKPKPPPPVKKSIDAKNSALTAATTSASRDRGRSRSPGLLLSRQATGNSSQGQAEHQYGRDGTSDNTGTKELSARIGVSPSVRMSAATTHLQPSSAVGVRPSVFDPKNTSFIAATLAASRSASPSPQAKSPSLGHTASMSVTHTPPVSRIRRRESFGSASISSMELPDTSSIAPTNSLISMFEEPRGGQDFDMDLAKRGASILVHNTPAKILTAKPPPRPVTPERPASPRTARAELVLSKPEAHPQHANSKTEPSPRPHAPKPQAQASRTMAVKPMLQNIPDMTPSRPAHGTEALQAHDLSMRRPPPPPKAGKLVVGTGRQSRSRAKPIPSALAQSQPQAKMRPPTPPRPRKSLVGLPEVARSSESVRTGRVSSSTMPTLQSSRRSNSGPRPTTSSTTSSNDTFVSASSNQTPIPTLSPPRRNSTPRLPSSIGLSTPSPNHSLAPPPLRRVPATASSTSLPLYSLSNAIVAGSLAAARLTPSNTGASTSSLGPAPPQNRHSKSPRLRQTLRQPVSFSDDETEARRIKKHHGHHTHSNKKHFHHEGARKRWREEIKPNERKRYEALWASNKGLLSEHVSPTSTSSTDAVHPVARRDVRLTSTPYPTSFGGSDGGNVSGYVLNIIVRDIWRRCRLPDDELAEVWDLVANDTDSGNRGVADPVDRLDKQQFVVGTWIIDQRLRGRKIPAKVSASVWDSAKGVRVSAPKSSKEGAKMRK